MTGKLKKATWCHEKTHRRQGKPDEHILGGKSASNFVSDAIQNSLDQRLDKKKPLTVRFKVNVLSNTKKKALLNAISWKDLEKHWGFDLSPHDYHKLRKLQNEYLSQNSRKHIVVMTVEESNAKGLTGSETDLHTNYERLIRGSHMPNTDKNSGGNFGWGKSVYFYYNLLQTAFFSSRHIDGNSGEVNLLVGRSYTPVRQNQNDGQLYATDSYFAHEIDADLNKWERLQGRDATPYQKRLNIKRKKTGNILNPDESGLSIMMPGFFIEDKDDNPIFDADRIIEEFYKANEELYWHQIQRGALKVYIDKLRDDNLQKTREVLDNPINSPLRFFMQAQNGPTNCKKINGSDQTSRKTFKGSESVTLPPKVDANLDPKQPYQPDFTLGFHSKSSSIVREENKPNKVAMIRGLGRVIEYVDIRPSFDSFNIFGVLEMGEAVSKSDKNKWAEEFIMTAEPHKHDKLEEKGTNLKSTYKTASAKSPGYTKAVREIYTNIKTDGWIDQLVETSVRSGKSLPKNFLSHFKLLGQDHGNKETISLKDVRQISFHNGIWRLSGRIAANEFTDDNFKVEITVSSLSDKNERLDKIDLTHISASHPHLINVSNTDPKKIIYEVVPTPVPGTQDCLKDFEFEIDADRKNITQNKISIEMHMKPVKS